MLCDTSVAVTRPQPQVRTAGGVARSSSESKGHEATAAQSWTRDAAVPAVPPLCDTSVAVTRPSPAIEGDVLQEGRRLDDQLRLALALCGRTTRGDYGHSMRRGAHHITIRGDQGDRVGLQSMRWGVPRNPA